MVTTFSADLPRAIHVWLGGGDLDDLLALMPGAESYGRAMGCEYATIEGRRGWARVLRQHGYEGDARLKKKL